MAAEKAKRTVKKGGKPKGGALGVKGTALFTIIVVVGVCFLPTSLILLIGMLPTLSAFFMGSPRAKVKVSTIAALNLVGCMPFIIKLWQGENNLDASMQILTTPLTIVIIYGAAMMGYVLDWAVTGVVSAYMYQKAERRVKAIEKRQESMIELWGAEVGAIGKVAAVRLEDS